MDKFLILQIIRGLDIGHDSGGAERFGVELSRALNRAGHRVMLCAFYRVGTETEQIWKEELCREGIDTFFLVDYRGQNNLPQYLLGLSILLKKINKITFDVTHSHFQLGSLTALLLKVLGKTKVALRTAHIRHEWEYGKNSRFLNYVFIQRLFPRMLDAQVGVSQAVVEYLSELPGSKGKGHSPILIYNAVAYGDQVNLNGPPEIIRKDTNDLIVISVGRLTEQKGYEYLLNAVPIVLKVVPEAKFFIVGDGDLRESLIKLAQTLKIERQVNFMGIRADVSYLLPQCDLFVLPSLWEGFPTVIMESMVSRTPVVATNIPGSRELVISGHNGWLVEPRNPENLASVIIHALKHPEERKKVADQASIDVKKYFIDTICQEYLFLYRRLLSL